MCVNGSAIEPIVNSGRKIRFLRNSPTGQKEFYVYALESPQDATGERTTEVVHNLATAFTCPTEPLIYIQFYQFFQTVLVLIEENALFPTCYDMTSFTVKVATDITNGKYLTNSV